MALRLNRFAIPLAQAPADPSLVGGKAANLGILIRAGAQVPDGFCLITDAYQEFVERNGLLPVIHAALDGRAIKDATAASEAAATILEAFLRAPMPEEIRAALGEALAAMDGGGMAVRSSAIHEDQAAATFAGQHETFLNVKGEQALEDAVRACWASLHNARALTYRLSQGDDQEEPALAVIIQKMVVAEAAGVAFTADPLTGNRDEVHISSTYGLGEALVSGLVNPDTFVLHGPDLDRVETRPGRKAVAVRLNPAGATIEQVIPEDDRERLSITPETAREIARAVRALAAQFGSPQDVEWAWAGNVLYILQSRPMVLPQREEPVWESPVPGARWYRNWRLGEWLSGPVTPLFATSLLPALVEGREATSRHRLDWGFPFAFSMLKPWYCVVNGYYFTRDDRDEATRQFGSDPADRLARSRAMVESLKEWRRRHRPNYLRRLRTLRQFNVEQASGPAILEYLDGLYTDAAEWWHLISTIGFGSEERTVRRLYDDVYGNVPKPEPIAFFSGYDNSALRAQRQLYAIAQEVTGEQETAVALDTYRAAHGHQLFTLDFAYPPIGETPDVLVGTIQAYRRNDAPPPAQALSGQQRRRSAAMRRLRQLEPVRPELLEEFNLQLEFRQLSAATRENAIYDFQRLWPLMRRAILELGRRLAKLGSIEAPEDVFFLTNEEVKTSVQDAAVADFTEQVRIRRDEHARNARLSPPDHIGGPEASRPSVRAMEQTGTIVEEAGRRVLIGQPASPGRATGPARVILSVDEFSKLQKGDILVCVAASPAWTVLFPLVAGLVTEVGGAATHSSLVAREYDLPAAVSTGIATQVIHDGQVITVDGSRGAVYLDETRL